MLGDIIPPSCMYGRLLKTPQTNKHTQRLLNEWSKDGLKGNEVTYIELTRESWGWQEIPVHWQGDSSEGLQLLRAFLVSFKPLLISNNVKPKTYDKVKPNPIEKNINPEENREDG